MQKQFKREQRYFVVKVRDAKRYLDDHQLEKLAEIADTISEGREKDSIPDVECVVIESDWPEYEPTWKAIEARMTGAQPAPSVPDVDALAQFIREIDGKHQLGAGALAERIVEWLAAAQESKK